MNPTPQSIVQQFANLPGNGEFPKRFATSEIGSPAALENPAGIPLSQSENCQLVDFAAKGYHVNVIVTPDQVVAAAQLMDRNGFAIDTITGVDWLAEAQMEVVYDYFHASNGLRVVVRSRVPREHPELPTISKVYPGANWHERETHDFFGIQFAGHGNLTPLLLPEDADYHPLRKDFAA